MRKPTESVDALRAEVLARFGPAADRVAPSVRELAASFAYGVVWSRPELSKRDRSIVTIAALAAMNCSDQWKLHVLRGMANGVSKHEIREIVTHLVPYIGFPLSASAAAAVADLVERADVDGSPSAAKT